LNTIHRTPILVVDDETEISSLTKEFLERSGNLAVDTASSVSEARAALAHRIYDAIVSDYQMPDEDGIQFLKSLRVMGDHTPFILFTGRGREEVVIEALNSGADFYLQKGGNPLAQFTELEYKILQAVRRKHAEESLRQRDEHLKSILLTAPDEIISVDRDYRITDINHPIAPNLDIVGRCMFDYIDPSFHDLVREKIKRVFDQGTTEQYELIAQGPKNEPAWYETNAGPIFENGTVTSAVLVTRVVTERKRAENALKESEEHFRDLSENAFEGIGISVDGIVVDCNRVISDMLGYKVEEMIGLNVYGLLTPESVSLVRERITGNAGGSCEVRALRKDGQIRLLRIQGKNITWKDKTARLSAFQDITESSNIKNVLQESEERHRTLADNTFEGIVISIDGVVIDANRSFAELVGCPSHQIIGQHFESLFTSESVELLREKHRLPEARRYEARLVRRNGDVLTVQLQGKDIQWKGRNARLTTISDITDRKSDEAILKASRERYERLFSAYIEGIALHEIVYDASCEPSDYRILEVNPAFEKIIGISREAVIGRLASEVYGTEKAPYLDVYAKVAETGESTSFETFFAPMDKHFSISVFSPAKGQFATLFMDVTERKREEKAFETSRHLLSKIVETSPNHLFIFDLKEHRNLFANRGMVELLGYDAEQIREMGSNLLDTVVHPDDIALVRDFQVRIRTMADGEIAELQYRVKNADGSWRWLHNRSTVFSRDPDGSARSELGMVEDITEKKRAEQELIDSQVKLRMAMELAKLGHWEYDVASDKFTFDDQFYALFATTAEKEGGTRMSTSEYARRFLPPEEAHKVGQETELAIRTMDPDFSRQVEHDVIRRDGQRRTIAIVFRVVKDQMGRTVKTYGVNQDITDRRQAEERLRQTNLKLNLLTSMTRHDINNQMMSLRGHLELLEEDRNAASAAHHLLMAKTAAERISAMIQFTKSYEEIGVQAPVWQDVRSLIMQASKDVQLDEVQLTVDVPAGTEIFADPLIVKVFQNLMHNSIRHGQRTTNIRFGLVERNGTPLIFCEDDGVGIAAGDKGRLFTKDIRKDHGFGLFLSREILGITGITITEEGRPEAGARFVMTVPSLGIRGPSGPDRFVKN
jgi:PAS domain S-box-containing protein